MISRAKAIVILSILIGGACLAAIMVPLLVASEGRAETANCVSPGAFVARMSRADIFTTLIPRKNMPAAIAFMSLSDKPVPADEAWYLEDGSVFGVAYMLAGCETGAVMLHVPKDKRLLFWFRGILLGERL